MSKEKVSQSGSGIQNILIFFKLEYLTLIKYAYVR